MDEQGEQPHAPFFRVWLCGAFRVERRVGTGYEGVPTAAWSGSSYPRLLLKALLCCLGRQIRREAVIEMLWPESDPEQAAQYLNTATTRLRRVLTPTRGQASMLGTEEDARHYLLEGQRLIWMDADEALALLKAAEHRGRTSPEALPLLEQAAAYLNRGAFLDGEEGLWALGKRATIERARYRCQLWLTEAYEEQGMAGQAELALGALLEEDPTDEDALCRLMDLLHRQGMTHKALRLYEQTCETLAGEGMEPTEATTILYERLKRAPRLPALSQPSVAAQPFVQQDEWEPLPAVLQETESRSALVSEGMSMQQTEPLLLFPDHVSRSAWTSRTYHRALDLLYTIPDAFSHGEDLGTLFALGASGLGALFEREWSSDAVLEVLQMILPVIKAMPMITRRTFLQAGAATLLGGLPLHDSKQISEAEVVQFYQALSESIAAGWKLFHTAGSAQVLAMSQAQLLFLQHMHPQISEPQRSWFYSSVYNLMGGALSLQERYQEALQAHTTAYIAALGAGNSLEVARSLLCQANNQYTLVRYHDAIETVKQALRILESGDGGQPLHIQAHLLGVWADCAMMEGDSQTARQQLDGIGALLDQINPNEEFDQASWYQLTGKYLCLAGNQAAGVQWFERALGELPGEWLVRRMLVLMPLLASYVTLRDLDASLLVLEQAVPLLEKIEARSMRRSCLQAGEGLLSVFPHEARVQALVAELSQSKRSP